MADIYLLNTAHGLVPLYDEDYEEKKKLKIGETYKAKVTKPRNIKFHRKFMALINLAFDNSKTVENARIAAENNEAAIPFTPDSYRKYCLIKSGFALIYQTSKGMFIEAESMSFDNMSEDRFADVYSKVLDFVIKDTQADEKLFVEQLINFI